jgi:hypothetical protein
MHLRRKASCPAHTYGWMGCNLMARMHFVCYARMEEESVCNIISPQAPELEGWLRHARPRPRPRVFFLDSNRASQSRGGTNAQWPLANDGWEEARVRSWRGELEVDQPGVMSMLVLAEGFVHSFILRVTALDLRLPRGNLYEH